MTIYAAGGVASPLKECCEEYGKINNVEFKYIFGKGFKLIEQISETGIGDLISFGAEVLSDRMEALDLVDGENRYCIGVREPVMLVHKGNPKNITHISDLLNKDVRVAVAYDGCLIGVWESILLNYDKTIIDRFRKKIKKLSDGCSQIVSFLLDDSVDVVIGWNSFQKYKEKSIDIISFNKEYRVFRSTNLSLLKCSKDKEAALALKDFIRSERGKEIYNSYGWETFPN